MNDSYIILTTYLFHDVSAAKTMINIYFSIFILFLPRQIKSRLKHIFQYLFYSKDADVSARRILVTLAFSASNLIFVVIDVFIRRLLVCHCLDACC